MKQAINIRLEKDTIEMLDGYAAELDKSRTSLIEKAIELYFDKLDEMVATKLLDLQKGNFSNDKALSGKHKGKYRKRAGGYRIYIYEKTS